MKESNKYHWHAWFMRDKNIPRGREKYVALEYLISGGVGE